MTQERQQLVNAIDALEGQRALLGDAVVDVSVAPLRALLAKLDAPVVTQAPVEQVLKQATVLFMDVVGSTPLSLAIDPEDFHAVVDGVLRAGTRAVEAHGGKVISYAGDNIIAVFGGSEASEDAAEQAVRAGLELVAVGKNLQADVLQRHGIAGTQVRVGIHTGKVLLGGGVQGNNTLSGLSVNVAARMEQTAPPGAMRISHVTYSMVPGIFQVEPQEPMAVKGLSQPMRTYLVTGIKPRALRVVPRGVEGVQTRMVGRDAELATLQSAFLQLYGPGKMSSVLVVGEAGLGKSRLLYEFVNWAQTLEQVCTVFQGGANPHIQKQPYGLLRDIFAWRYQLHDSDTMQVKKDKLQSGVCSVFQEETRDMAQAHAHLLGQLIGLDFSDSPQVKGILTDARQVRNRAFHAAAQLFRVSAQHSGNPVVLQLDDLHWADEASLEFLSYLMQVNQDVPMLIIGLTRDALAQRTSGSALVQKFAHRLELQALNSSESRMLAGELLQNLPDIPDVLVTWVTKDAGGNPLYVEELVKMLVDQGVIDTSGEPWQLHRAKWDRAIVPPNLTALLQARLDELPANVRWSLQEASAIGPVFWPQILADLDTQSLAALPSLVQRQLVIQGAVPSAEATQEFLFKSSILHQVTYETLLKSQKRELHAKLARWFEYRSGDRVGDYLGITAEHYEKAGETLRAVEFFARAAEQARRGFDHEAVLRQVAHALTLLDAIGPDAGTSNTLDALRWRLLDVRETTWGLKGERDLQRADQAALQEVAERLADVRCDAVLALRRAGLALRSSDARLREDAARHALALADAAGDEELGLETRRALCAALFVNGEAAAALVWAREGVEQARTRGLLRLEGLFLSDLAGILYIQRDYLGYMEMLGQVLGINRQLADRVNEANNLGNRAVSWMQFGALDEARADFTAALAMSRAVGNRTSEGAHLTNLSRLLLMQGDAQSALEHAHAGLALALATEAVSWQVISGIYLGNAALALGRVAQALQAFEDAEAKALALGSAWRFDALAGAARACLASGDLAGALGRVEVLLSEKQTDGGLDGSDLPFLIDITCVQVLERARDARGPGVLSQAHSALQQQAQAIGDDRLRHGFLNYVPEHHAIVVACSAKAQELTP